MYRERISKEQKAVELAVRVRHNRVQSFPNISENLQDIAKRNHFDVVVCSGDSHKSGYCDCALDRIVFALCEDGKISADERDNLNGGV